MRRFLLRFLLPAEAPYFPSLLLDGRLILMYTFPLAGVHPHEAKSWDEETEEALRELLANQEVVALGECGLDFNRNFSPQETQLEVFQKQVNFIVEVMR